MTKKRATKIPSYRFHKASGQAIVTLSGRDFYLGKHGSNESHSEYERVTGEWILNGRKLRPDENTRLSIDEVMASYYTFAQGYYRKHNSETKEVKSIRDALRHLRPLYGTSIANEFGPQALKTVRQSMIEAGLCRITINNHVGRLKRMFKWAVAEELIDGGIYHRLQAVTGLRRGRSKAPEPKPIIPVLESAVEATLPFVSRQVAAMASLQLLTAMRPGEVVLMRTGDIDRSEKVWVYRPSRHKTEHHGYDRIVRLGPRAQEILGPWLKANPTKFLFSPIEAEEERNAKRRQQRRSPMTPSQKKRKPRGTKRPHYTVDSYRRAICNGAKKAGVEHWHPNQLRHTAATKFRSQHGLEISRIILGHRSAVVTEIYAEVDEAQACQVIEQAG